MLKKSPEADQADAFYAAIAEELDVMDGDATVRFLSRLVLLLSADLGNFERAHMLVQQARPD